MDAEFKPEELTDEQRKVLVKFLLSSLRRLRATPRSDWHAGFEALLRLETREHVGLVDIRTEVELGVVPPRTDYVVLVADEGVEWSKAVFRHFRKTNILEYKNPHDSLNERVLCKVCGYANLYAGLVEHEGDRPSDQVTITIFRAVRNPGLFREMEREGTLVADEVPGIYHVVGYTRFPFRIVITGELVGEEYAAFRVLTDRAEEADVESIIRGVPEGLDEAARGHYEVLLRLVMEKNPQFVELMRRNEEMGDVLMDILRDRVDAVADARAKEAAEAAAKEAAVARDREMASAIDGIVDRFGISASEVMDAMGVPESRREALAGLIG